MNAAITGVCFGLGLWLVLRGWKPRPEPLAVALARMHGGAATQDSPGASWDLRVGAAAVRRVGLMARAVHRARADLRIVGRTPEEQAARTLLFGGFGLILGPWAGLVGWLAGATPPAFVLGGVSLIGVAVGASGPWATVGRGASKLRRDFLVALAAWCDLLAMSLAAGRGVGQAVRTASLAGDGPAFAELRGALDSGHVRGDSPWASLSTLGADLGIDDLQELASTITMAGEDGVAVREAVHTKAHTIRERIGLETERSAERDTAQMAGPTFAVALGFLVFISYPALIALSNGF
jgi:Flp pilus assembly protein TadB